MSLFNKSEDSTPVPTDTPSAPKRSPFKWVALGVGGVFAVAHVGLLGYVFNSPKVPEYPVIQFPQGDYSSYEVEATKDGYKIKYRANDPTVLESDRSLELDKHKKGLFGATTEMRREFRRDQYTIDGTRNIGGSFSGAEGKSLVKTEECIRADAGARSQGAMAGTAISAGLVVPAVSSIPYIGWLAGGWALLLGQQAGESIGSEIGSSFNDC